MDICILRISLQNHTVQTQIHWNQICQKKIWFKNHYFPRYSVFFFQLFLLIQFWNLVRNGVSPSLFYSCTFALLDISNFACLLLKLVCYESSPKSNFILVDSDGNRNILPEPSWMCWSAHNFWKIDFNELHFWSILNLIFAGYHGSNNQVRNKPKMESVEIYFLNLTFQNSSEDQQGF